MNTKALRQKILDLAIHGKLVPQDSNDEPASVLLERIRAEKERLIKEGKIKKPKKTKAACDKPRYPFELSKGWAWTTVGEVCSSFSTGPFGSMVHKSDYVSTNGTPIINPANIVNGEILNEGIKKVSNNKVVELTKYRLSENDILLARRGDLTKCAIVTRPHINSLCGTGTFFLHLIFVSPQYFRYVYSSNLVQEILKKDCVGATMDNLNQSVLANIYIPIPPLGEQMRINKRLEYYFSLLNLAESEGNSLQVTIKQTKFKILDLAIHGKLVPQDPNDEPATELLKRINPKAEITCDTPRYGKLPKGWCITHIEDLFEAVSAKRVLKNDWKSNGVPFYRAREIVQLNKEGSADKDIFISEELYQEMKDKYGVPCVGDIMVSAVGSIGYTYIVKKNDFFYYKDASVLCLKNSNNLYSEFFSVWLSTPYMQEQMYKNSKGTTVDTITLEKLKNYIVPLPPVQEQHRIVAKIEDLFAQLDKIEVSL